MRALNHAALKQVQGGGQREGDDDTQSMAGQSEGGASAMSRCVAECARVAAMHF